MNLITDIIKILSLPQEISEKTKRTALKELIENNIDYDLSEDFVKKEKTFAEEYKILGTTDFLEKYSGLFSEDQQLGIEITVLDKTIYELYKKD
ncbi:MAG: hypothetical protein ABIC91_06300 [Nanoarchaeota archaeon]|nr:hypothetical protein [Nanoarchaeota archaeon]MBU1030385.1 hypothetical protein [Nanoarchaeota archaeon]MBU1850274.1 hypothetical protein [Nanoarchaeota archaeon]